MLKDEVFQTVLDKSPVPQLIISKDGNLIDANAAFHRLSNSSSITNLPQLLADESTPGNQALLRHLNVQEDFEFPLMRYRLKSENNTSDYFWKVTKTSLTESSFLLSIQDSTKFVTLITKTPDNQNPGIILLNPDLKVVFVNDRLQTEYQEKFNRSIVEDSQILNYASETQNEDLKIIYEQVLSGEGVHSDIEFNTPSGTLFYHIERQPHLDAEGKVFAITMLVYETTDKYETEMVLRANSDQFESLIVSLDGIIWEADATSLFFSYVSPQSKKILGYHPEEWYESNEFWPGIIHPRDRQHTVDSCARFTEAGLDHVLEYRTRHKKGHYIWVRDNVSVVIKDGKPTLLRGVIFDITKEKEAEDELLRTNKQLQTAAQIANLGYWSFDESTDRFYWSSEAQALWQPALLTGVTTVDELITQCHPDDRPRLRLNFKKSKDGVHAIDLSFRNTVTEDTRWFQLQGSITVQDGSMKQSEGTIQDITSQKSHEAELQTSRQQFVTLIESIQDGFFSLDRDFTITYWNTAAEKLTETAKQDAVNRNVWDVFPHLKEHNLPFYTKTTAAMEDRKPRNFEAWYPLTSLWLEARLYPSEEGLTVFFKDITQAKEIEAQLTRFKKVIDNSLSAVTITDHLGEVLYCNQSFVQNIGYDEQQLQVVGGPCGIYKDPEMASQVSLAIQEGKFWEGDLELINAQGEEIDYYVNAGPVLDDSGELIATFGILTDIRDRKAAEQRIKKSNDRYRAVERATNDVTYDWNFSLGTLEWSESIHTLFGHEWHKAPQPLSVWATNVHPDDYPEVEASLNQALYESEDDQWRQEYRLRKANGEYANILERGYIFRDENHQPTRMIGALQDITVLKTRERDLKKANEQLMNQAEALKKSNIELEQFAYVASHDLQEPLRMITGFLDLLKKKYGSDLNDTANSYVDFAVDGANRMRELIKDLLAYSRIGRTPKNHQSIDLNQVMADMEVLFRKELHETRGELNWDKLPTIFAPVTSIRQLFQNLIGNAIKYRKAGEPPLVHITAQQNDSSMHIHIKDNGMGMNPDDVKRMFVLFQRGPQPDDSKGSGIGLAICQKIVESLKGKIEVKTALGQGSTFTVVFPNLQV